MTATTLLVQNIVDLFSISSIMQGGKMNNSMNSTMYDGKQKNILMIILMLLILLLIKGLIVYLLYNFMMPKLIYSLSENKSLEIIESNFKTISFTESVLLVILFNVLFSS
jgi:cytochrome b subunit of formate dehydrogenase